jgi:formylglycine-generating enzyme required for sulfatase activity
VKERAKFVVAVSIAALIILEFNLRAQNPRNLPSPQPRNALGMEFVKIPAGEFMMGCSTGDQQCNPDETPRHRVQITKSFEIGKYEVTQAQWMALMQTNPSSNKGDTRPVETVSKLEALDFIAKLNDRNDGYRYRLPTEAEWEYAARAGMDAPYSGPLDQVAWYAANSEDETHPVGQKKPNAWGLYDTQGNVREWVSDFYQSDYYSVSPAVDPTGPQLGARGRGGFVAGPRGGPGRGGRGGFPAAQGGNPQLPPITLPPGATQQQQIDALRQQVEQLQQQLQQLRAEFESVLPRGGPPGFGPPQGPAVIGPDGSLIDPLDGLPTGLPVVRGGGWDQSAAFQRVSARYSYYGPTLRVSDIGFRVVREPVAQTQ